MVAFKALGAKSSPNGRSRRLNHIEASRKSVGVGLTRASIYRSDLDPPSDPFGVQRAETPGLGTG